MPDLQTLVERMVDAGESDEDIDLVVEEYKRLNPPKPPVAPAQKIANDEEDSFFGGFTKSLFGGEALEAGLKGALGFAKGAIADIPSTLLEGAKDAFQVATNPIETLKQAPGAFREGIPEVAKSMMETTTRAGSDPEAFGRMVGQFTGQPAILAKAPALRTPIGKTVEGTGRLMRKHQPVSGLLPRMVEPRIARTIERGVGGGLERLGQKIKKQPTPTTTDEYGSIVLDQPIDTIPIKPSIHPSTRYRSRPYEPGPRKPPPPAGAKLLKEKVPSTEEQVALAIQEVRDQFARAEDPTSQLPPPEYSLGAPSPSEQPRFSVRAPKTPKKGVRRSLEDLEKELAERKAGTYKKPTTATAPAETTPAFEPSVDPNTFSSTDLDLLKSRRAELKAALEKMQSGESVDPATGEIFEPRRAGKTMNAPNLKDMVRKFISSEEGSAIVPEWADTVAEFVTKKRPTNPLRPEVPEGQVSNRRMIELSNAIDAENRAATQNKSIFSPGASEFSPDLIPEVENIFEGVAPKFKPRPEPEFDIPEPVDFWGRQKRLFQSETGSVGKDVKQKMIGQPSPIASRLVKEGSVVRQKTKEVGPKGQSWSVTSPDGKHLGDITVTPEEIAALKAHEGGMLADIDDNLIAQELYEAKFEDLMKKHKVDKDAAKVEPKSNRTKNVENVEPEEVIPAEKATEPKPIPTKEELPSIDPEKAFGKDGDIKPIVDEAARLDKSKAVDNKYKSLLPKQLRYELGAGESYRQRLRDLVGIIREGESASPEESAIKVAARDEFLKSVRESMGREETRSNVPLLNLSKVKPSEFRTPVQGRLKKLLEDKARSKPETWTSPKKP